MPLGANWQNGQTYTAANQNAVEGAINANTVVTTAASAVNGIVKCNGAGTFTAAVAGTDFAAVGSSGESILAVTTVITLPAASYTNYVAIITAGSTTLPTAVGNSNRYTLKNATSSGCVVSTTSSQTIDGSALPITIPAWASVDLVPLSGSWYVV